MLFKLSVFMTGFLVGMLSFYGAAESQQATIGKTFDEIVKAAAKEGKVRIGSGLTEQEAPLGAQGV